MAEIAYVLIQTEAGKSAEVAQLVRSIDGVDTSDDVTGPYDVVVRIEAPSIDDVGRIVMRHIHLVEGITRTVTCSVMNP
jgi:DNA-binding Lrp family transcriptional regulator